MGSERRRHLLLGALLIVLGVVFYRVWSATSAGPAPASNGREGGASTARSGAAPGTAAPDVHLQALSGEHPKPVRVQRNLFRFKPKAPPPPPPGPPRPSTSAAPTDSASAGPPPLAPITLKFIGVVEQGGSKRKIAILSDGIGPPFFGEEGKQVAGRYKILRIGAESIEMSYLDGRGRQTIRLTGS